uniref:BrnT family toxin n=1 Tax=uncultured Thiotrichaceae bacterium TaxID=298394 RepID=A0A6S6UHF6_9GAMM|nr:MAG: Unknown protein [uncultured Thiotrichaceae bacterium]
MNDLSFEWDEAKASSNLNKHGVFFDEAKTVFLDDHARLISDPDHSEAEDRYILLGYSEKSRMLLVCHFYRDDEVVRLISARRAEKHEKRQYEGFKL